MKKRKDNILPRDGEVYLYEELFSVEESALIFNDLRNNIAWKQDHLQMYGREVDLPRLTAWYANPDKTYEYSGIVNYPLAWTDLLLDLKQYVEDITDHIFNSALLNQYRNEHDSMGWHSDDEPELGINPVIASLSFGGSRTFQFKHKTNKQLKTAVMLHSGSLLLMSGATQHHWVHQIPKSKEVLEPRINITFRAVL